MITPSKVIDNEQKDDSILTSVTVPPHEMRPVFVDESETEELIPKLTVEAKRDGWNVIRWIPIHKIMEDGSIRLSVVVRNLSAQPMVVRVRQDA